jgi:hypothetical protein
VRIDRHPADGIDDAAAGRRGMMVMIVAGIDVIVGVMLVAGVTMIAWLAGGVVHRESYLYTPIGYISARHPLGKQRGVYGAGHEKLRFATPPIPSNSNVKDAANSAGAGKLSVPLR